MTNALINGQDFADSFLGLLGNSAANVAIPTISTTTRGVMSPSGVPMAIQMKLPEIFDPSRPANKYKELFKGNISLNGNDHSAADLALCGHLAMRGLTITEADQLFRASGLYRPKWDEKRGAHTYGELTLAKACSNVPTSPQGGSSAASTPALAIPQFKFLDIGNYRPTFVPNGMPPRQFVGPSICNGIRLFPANALSTLVALGAMGKTSLLLSIACHVAAGKNWNSSPVKQQKVAMIFCEEDQQEANRKFSAIISDWTPTEQKAVIDNLLLIPLLGIDARLTTIEKNQYKGSGVAETLIEILHKFGLKEGLVIFDHMQGFASGDLNISETATAICREANKVVDATGSAVVFAAHIAKTNIKAEEFTQGFAVGSLAFENATRQMAGLIPMTIENAKKFGLELTRKEYAWLSLAKNSYGGASDGVWLKKVYSSNYHTVVMEPIQLTLPMPAEKLSELQKVMKRAINHIAGQPFTTKNALDRISGLKGELKASKAMIRYAVDELIRLDEIRIHKVTDQERKELSIPKQVTEILRLNNVKTAAKALNLNDLEKWSAN